MINLKKKKNPYFFGEGEGLNLKIDQGKSKYLEGD